MSLVALSTCVLIMTSSWSEVLIFLSTSAAIITVMGLLITKSGWENRHQHTDAQIWEENLEFDNISQIQADNVLVSFLAGGAAVLIQSLGEPMMPWPMYLIIPGLCLAIMASQIFEGIGILHKLCRDSGKKLPAEKKTISLQKRLTLPIGKGS